MEQETISISLKDAEKLGLSWGDIADAMGYNFYAVKEGMLDRDDIIKVPVKLIKP